MIPILILAVPALYSAWLVAHTIWRHVDHGRRRGQVWDD